MISRRFIGWAVLIILLVAVAFSRYAYDVSPAVFFNWLGTLLATFISVLAAVVVGLLLFNYQTGVTDERKRRDLVRLTATELGSIIQTLQQDVDSGSYHAVFLHSPMSEQAARSGLLTPQTTADLIRFGWNVQVHNQMVAEFNTVLWSASANPNGGAILQTLLSRARENRDTMLSSAQIILRELLLAYPQAFPQDQTNATPGPVSSSGDGESPE